MPWRWFSVIGVLKRTNMPPRKKRLPVVLDTNVLIGYYLSTNPASANSQIYRLWRNQRKLQLIVSDETVAEYLGVLRQLGVTESHLTHLKERFTRRKTVTYVKLGHTSKAAEILMIISFWPQQPPAKLSIW